MICFYRRSLMLFGLLIVQGASAQAYGELEKKYCDYYTCYKHYAKQNQTNLYSDMNDWLELPKRLNILKQDCADFSDKALSEKRSYSCLDYICCFLCCVRPTPLYDRVVELETKVLDLQGNMVLLTQKKLDDDQDSDKKQQIEEYYYVEDDIEEEDNKSQEKSSSEEEGGELFFMDEESENNNNERTKPENILRIKKEELFGGFSFETAINGFIESDYE